MQFLENDVDMFVSPHENNMLFVDNKRANEVCFILTCLRFRTLQSIRYRFV